MSRAPTQNIFYLTSDAACGFVVPENGTRPFVMEAHMSPLIASRHSLAERYAAEFPLSRKLHEQR